LPSQNSSLGNLTPSEFVRKRQEYGHSKAANFQRQTVYELGQSHCAGKVYYSLCSGRGLAMGQGTRQVSSGCAIECGLVCSVEHMGSQDGPA
jgi:hypothetical protein